MTEVTSTTPRCRVGTATGDQCPRTATVNPFGDDHPPEVCEYHHRLWELAAELQEAKVCARWLALWEQQAEMVGCPPLEDALRFVRAEADLELARLGREVSEAEVGG
jgi:hypothetical protein